MKKFLPVLTSVMITAMIFSSVPAYAAESGFSKEQRDYYASLGLDGTTVNVYNWGEYISDGEDGSMDVVKEFENLTGAKVNYSNFESNENMYSKLSGGGVSYDVIVPSDYMVQRLIDEDMLLPIDYDNVPNFRYVRDDCKNLYFDPDQRYSVCFNTGTTILIYNKKLVKDVPDSWSVLWDEQYRGKVLMFNNSRDAFAIAQSMLGQDLNSDVESQWVEAAKLLAEQKDKVSPVYVMDEVFNLMESGEYAFATYYAGDYVLMQENNPDLGYCFPKEGVNDFYDAFCVPTCSQNKKGAEAFINFMHEPQVAFANTEYIYYASANRTVAENKESSLYANDAVYPQQKIKSQYFENLPQGILELQNKLWSMVKSGKMSVSSKEAERKIYVESAAVAVVTVAIVIASVIRRKKKSREQDLSDLYEQN